MLARLRRSNPGINEGRDALFETQALLLAALLALPILVTLAVSFALVPVFLDRTLIWVGLPGYLALVTQGGRTGPAPALIRAVTAAPWSSRTET